MAESTYIVQDPISGKDMEVKGARSAQEAVAILYGDMEPLPDKPEIYSEGTMIPTSESEIRNEKLRAMMSLATEPEEQIAVFQEFFPEAETEMVRDRYILARGTDPITGEPFEGYINEPGPSPRDLTQTLTQLAFFAPSSRLVGKIGSRVGRTFVSGLAGGLTEAGRQEIVDQLTTREIPFSSGAIALASVGEAGGEVVGEAFSFMTRFVRNAAYFNKEGLTQRGRQVLQDIGIDPDLVDDNPALLDAIRKKPGRPSVAAKAVEEERPDLMGNVRITGRASAPQEAGQDALDALREIYDQEKLDVDTAYELAKATDAKFRAASISESFREVRKSLAEDAFIVNKGPVKEALGHFKRDVYRAEGMTGIEKFSVRGYELWRKKVSGMRQSLGKKKKTERRALSALVHRMDERILHSLQYGIERGDPEAIKLWNEAISRNAAFMDKWTANYIIEDAVTTGKTAEHMASTMLRTAGKVSERQQALEMTKEILGADTQGWNDLRSEYLTQMLRKGQSDIDSFDPGVFSSNFSRLMTTEPGVVRTVLNEGEIQILKDISRLAKKHPMGTLISAIGDLIYMRYGVQGHAIAGAMKRSAIRAGATTSSERPLFARIASVGGAVAAKEANREEESSP